MYPKFELKDSENCVHFLSIIRLVISTQAGAFTSNKNDSVDVYKVYRIFTKSWTDIQKLAELRRLSDEKLDFWLDSRRPGQFSDVMISQSALNETNFLQYLHDNQLDYKLNIPNVQKLIDKENNYVSEKRRSHSDKNPELRAFERRLRDSPMFQNAKFVGHGRSFEKVGELKAQYSFGEYGSYTAMMRYMRAIEFYYPHIARLVRLGTSHEGRPIEGLKIGYPVANTTKRVFWIDGNIHAREWASSHSVLFIINQLIAGYGKDSQITHYVDNMNFFLVPNLNPDGYEYSRSSPQPQVRLWRKNRSPEKCVQSAWGGWRCCQGVDLNRNFDFHWSETGASSNPCSNLYAGEYAASEPETKFRAIRFSAVANFLTSKNVIGKVDGFISLHTYAQMWIHPFSHEKNYYPHDLYQLQSVAQRAVKRLKSIYGTEYQVGTGSDLLSPASGGSDDWAKDTLNVKYVYFFVFLYLIELRPNNEYRNGFILNQHELIPTAIETFEGIKVVIETILEEHRIYRTTTQSTTTSQFTTSQPPLSQSFLHFVKSQPTSVSMNIKPSVNVSVSNSLGVHQWQPQFNSTALPSTAIQWNGFSLPRYAQLITTSARLPPTTQPTTYSTTPSTSTTTSPLTTTTSPSTTTKTTQTTTSFWTVNTQTHPIVSFPPRFPMTLSAAISVLSETSTQTPSFLTFSPSVAGNSQTKSSDIVPEVSFEKTASVSSAQWSSTSFPVETTKTSFDTNLSTRITELSTTETDPSSVDISSQSTIEVVETTSTTLSTPSTRRYGPRFLTPPSAPPRAWTPLSFINKPTPTPLLLPPSIRWYDKFAA
ncbi:Carboxypeptidase B [Aphelenchoides besseyi]|nr:Carboxypeptidase B [Aphelenchoides besseyi]